MNVNELIFYLHDFCLLLLTIVIINFKILILFFLHAVLSSVFFYSPNNPVRQRRPAPSHSLGFTAEMRFEFLCPWTRRTLNPLPHIGCAAANAQWSLLKWLLELLLKDCVIVMSCEPQLLHSMNSCWWIPSSPFDTYQNSKRTMNSQRKL